ncbi:MAG TPA: DUF4190 domain-containing protein [Micromonosporaceae bacterium]
MVRNRLLSRHDDTVVDDRSTGPRHSARMASYDGDPEDTLRTPVTDDVRYDEGRVHDSTVVTEPTGQRWAHVSAAATIALIVGLSAVYAALTGVLAPVAIALGIIGVIVSIVGLAAASRTGVTGHSLATLGLIGSLAGIVLGILAITNVLPWLHHTDQVAHFQQWLDAQLPWIKSW